jgi:hypothetical protein
MDETLRKIRSAYAIAGREQPAHYSPLTAWNELSIEVHEAIIGVYQAGRRDGREEADRARGQPPLGQIKS